MSNFKNEEERYIQTPWQYFSHQKIVLQNNLVLNDLLFIFGYCIYSKRNCGNTFIGRREWRMGGNWKFKQCKIYVLAVLELLMPCYIVQRFSSKVLSFIYTNILTHSFIPVFLILWLMECLQENHVGCLLKMEILGPKYCIKFPGIRHRILYLK